MAHLIKDNRYFSFMKRSIKKKVLEITGIFEMDLQISEVFDCPIHFLEKNGVEYNTIGDTLTNLSIFVEIPGMSNMLWY